MSYELIKQVNDLLTEKESSSSKNTVPSIAKTSAKAVYHRDYVKTRNKKYRKNQKRPKQ